jgi:hypothetical protein
MNKKVLVTVAGGVASAYAEPGIDVVILDLDDSKVTHPSEMIPIHTNFQPLMKFAGVEDDWIISDDGRVGDAYYAVLGGSHVA